VLLLLDEVCVVQVPVGGLFYSCCINGMSISVIWTSIFTTLRLGPLPFPCKNQGESKSYFFQMRLPLHEYLPVDKKVMRKTANVRIKNDSESRCGVAPHSRMLAMGEPDSVKFAVVCCCLTRSVSYKDP
jgi:hypothetical protein